MATLSTRGLHAPGTFSPATRLFRTRAVCPTCQRRWYTLRRFVPRVLEPETWRAMIPKPWRRTETAKPRTPKTEWNPSTIYIVYGLLIGSQAIHSLTLKREKTSYSRKTENKIALLKDVIDRVQKGEKVDVEGLLGTGNLLKEKEWEEVMRELEAEDSAFTASQQRRAAETGDIADEKRKSDETRMQTARPATGAPVYF